MQPSADGLFFDRVVKSFGGTQALKGASLKVARGEIVALLGAPTASLPADDVGRLFSALRPLKSRGVGMIYVSHRLDEIFRVADRVAVLRDGQMVGMRPIEYTTPEELVSLIVGRKAREINRPPVQDGPAILRVQSLATPHVGPVTLP